MKFEKELELAFANKSLDDIYYIINNNLLEPKQLEELKDLIEEKLYQNEEKITPTKGIDIVVNSILYGDKK